MRGNEMPDESATIDTRRNREASESAHDYGTGCKLTMLWIARRIMQDYQIATSTGSKLAREIDDRLVELINSHGGSLEP